MKSEDFKMTGTEAIKSITLKKGDKTATMTIIDTAGDGFDSNDKFKIAGDASIFTSKDITGTLDNYKSIEKGSNVSADVEKDSSGKIKAEQDKEYRLGSLADSLMEKSKPITTTTTETTKSSFDNAKYAEITNRCKDYIVNMARFGIMTGNETAYTNAMTNYITEMLSVGTTTKTTSTVTSQDLQGIDPNAKIFADTMPAITNPTVQTTNNQDDKKTSVEQTQQQVIENKVEDKKTDDTKKEEEKVETKKENHTVGNKIKTKKEIDDAKKLDELTKEAKNLGITIKKGWTLQNIQDAIMLEKKRRADDSSFENNLNYTAGGSAIGGNLTMAGLIKGGGELYRFFSGTGTFNQKKLEQQVDAIEAGRKLEAGKQKMRTDLKALKMNEGIVNDIFHTSLEDLQKIAKHLKIKVEYKDTERTLGQKIIDYYNK